jgi:hypothetical protein
MPGGAMGYIGDPSDHRLLGDKVATAALLRGVGIPVPNEFDPGDGRTWSSPGALFVKPRFGRGGRGTFTVDIVPGGRCRVEGKQVVTVDEFRATLRAAGGQPLVQERLFSCSELSDLATGGVAPVLRISTARTPGGEPFFHSAHISVRVPGERKLNFIRSHMRAAVDCDGLMSVAVWFAEPAKRYSSLPWNGAAILGRRLPGVPCAIRLALSAMSLFPGLAVISWDLILTAKGPVVLEGNSCGEWILLNFDLIVGKRLEAAGKLLRLWCETSVSEGAGKSGQAKAPNAT